MTTKIPHALLDSVERKVDQCLALAGCYYSKVVPRPTLEYGLRGRAAGQMRMSAAKADGARMRLNAELLLKYGQEFIEEVVPHELAHLVAFLEYGNRIKPHGKEWQFVMREVMRCQPNTTHTFDAGASRRMAAYEYACHCHGKVHELSAIRHGKVARGRARYLCKKCEAVLSPVSG